MMSTFRKLFITLLLSAAISGLSAQVEQKGVVLEYQGEQTKTPLSAVSIVAKDAGSVMSENDGTFQLQFRTLHAGSNIQMRRIEKAGYEVMNPEVVEQFRVGSKESRPIQIVMCSKARLQQLRANYRSVASKRYEQQLKLMEAEAERLRREGKLKEEEYNARLDSLEEEYDDKQTKLETYIDKFARIDLSEVDACEQQIVALVQGGKFDEAIALYDQQDFPAKVKQNREARRKLVDMKTTIAQAELAQAEETFRLRQSIDRQVTLLYMAGGDENTMKAHHILHQVFLADTTDWEARRAYAVSLEFLGFFEEQRAVLLSGLAIAPDDYARGMIYLPLIDNSMHLQRFDDAYQCAQTAEKILTPLQDSIDAVSTRALPVWSSAMLNIKLQQGDLETCRLVAEHVAQQWSPDTLSAKSVNAYIGLLYDLSDYYSGIMDHAKSIWCTRESLKLCNILERMMPHEGRRSMAYASACSILLRDGLLEEGLNSAQKCMNSTFESLMKSKGKSATADASCVYFMLAEVLVQSGQYAYVDSLIYQTNETKLFERLNAVSDNLAHMYGALFRIFQAQYSLHAGNVEEAKALTALAEPVLASSEEGQSLLELLRPEMEARIALSQGSFAKAESSCADAIRISRNLYEESNDAWDADQVCKYYLLLSDIQKSNGAIRKARKSLRQAEKYAVFEINKLNIASRKNDL